MCTGDISLWMLFLEGLWDVPKATEGIGGKEGFAQDPLNANTAPGSQTSDRVTHLNANWSAPLGAHLMI